MNIFGITCLFAVLNQADQESRILKKNRYRNILFTPEYQSYNIPEGENPVAIFNGMPDTY